MKAILVKSLIFVLTVFALAAPVFAKGQIDLMTIAPVDGSQKPIEITDPQILSQFSFWSDQLFAPGQNILAKPPKTGRAYEVSYYMKDETGKLQLRYAFQYAAGDPAAIYLPGRGEPGYTLNVGTLLRDGMDGHWFRASQSWVRFMQSTLASQPAPGAASPAFPWFFSPVLGAAAGMVIFLAAAFLFFQVRKHKSTNDSHKIYR